MGGFRVAYKDSPLGKYRFTWPFARLTIAAEGLRLAPRGPLCRSQASIAYSTSSKATESTLTFAGRGETPNHQHRQIATRLTGPTPQAA